MREIEELDSDDITKSLPRKLFGAASLGFIAALILEVMYLSILTARAEEAAGHALSWY